MQSKLTQLIFTSLLSIGTVTSAFAGNPAQQGGGKPAKGARLNPAHGSPLKPAPMRVTKGNKLTTHRAQSATLQATPVSGDPVTVEIDNYYGGGIALHDTPTTGMDMSARKLDADGKMKPLTPGMVRSVMTGAAKTASTPLDRVGTGGKKEFPISQPANKPMAMVFTSDDVGHTDKQYTRIVKAKGKPRSYKIDTSGAFPVFYAEGGDLAGDFAPYLNENVIGVTPAHYPALGGKQGQGQQQGGGLTKISEQARIVVRGGVNAIPPGSKFRIVNLTTGKQSEWMDAHPETGSFRTSADVNGLNDNLAIDVQTGTDTNESAIITTRYEFRSTYDASVGEGKIPLLKAKFRAGTPVVESAPHPVSGKAFKAAKQALTAKIGSGETFESITTNMKLTPAEAREFAALLVAHGDKFDYISAGGGKTVDIFTKDPNGRERSANVTFQSTLAPARTWVLDPEPADKPAQQRTAAMGD